MVSTPSTTVSTCNSLASSSSFPVMQRTYGSRCTSCIRLMLILIKSGLMRASRFNELKPSPRSSKATRQPASRKKSSKCSNWSISVIFSLSTTSNTNRSVGISDSKSAAIVVVRRSACSSIEAGFRLTKTQPDSLLRVADSIAVSRAASSNCSIRPASRAAENNQVGGMIWFSSSMPRNRHSWANTWLGSLQHTIG